MITTKQALKALDDLDDYARMDVGVDAFGPVETLKKFIGQQELYKRDAAIDDLQLGLPK